jgi:hypothetical protein
MFRFLIKFSLRRTPICSRYPLLLVVFYNRSIVARMYARQTKLDENQSQELNRFYDLIHFNGVLLSKLRLSKTT